MIGLGCADGQWPGPGRAAAQRRPLSARPGGSSGASVRVWRQSKCHWDVKVPRPRPGGAGELAPSSLDWHGLGGSGLADRDSDQAPVPPPPGPGAAFKFARPGQLARARMRVAACSPADSARVSPSETRAAGPVRTLVTTPVTIER